jgi:hypothetical protein
MDYITRTELEALVGTLQATNSTLQLRISELEAEVDSLNLQNTGLTETLGSFTYNSGVINAVIDYVEDNNLIGLKDIMVAEQVVWPKQVK